MFVSRRVSLTGHDWLRCGLDLWDAFGHKARDYFVTDQKMESVIPKFAPVPVEKVALYIR